MTGYSGHEPRVGEIRALRTFRIDPAGRLVPLFGTDPWIDGTNTASCRAGGDGGRPHAGGVPDSGCTCGFYAFADEAAAAQYPQARHVLAVVLCWGRVVAGTRGLRCEYASVEALWLAGRVPASLAGRVSSNYPGARLYRTRQELLDRHPPDRLDCYEDPTARGTVRAAVRTVAVVVLLGLGALSLHPALAGAWTLAASASAVALLAATSTRSAHDRDPRRAHLLCAALALWAGCAQLGVVGLVLVQGPMLMIVALVAAQLIGERRRAGRFPTPPA